MGIFGPEAEYEVHGDVDDVVFPCGYTMDPDGDTLNIYYGAADCAIALARASVRSLLAWLDANGSCARRAASAGSSMNRRANAIPALVWASERT